MIEKDKRSQNYYSIDTIIKEAETYYNQKEVTNKELLEFMIGDSDNWNGGDYTVHKYSDKSKRTFLQRLNLCWVYPLFIVTIPAQYLISGSWGVNRNTKIGKIIGKLVGWNN